MNTIQAAAAVAAFALATGTADARDLVAGLSPHVDADVQKTRVEMIVRHVLDTVRPGEVARVFDADSGRLIATFTVPDKAAYRNPRAKLAANKAAMRDLKAFIDASRAVPGSIDRIDVPAFARVIRRSYPAGDGADLFLFGSPLAANRLAPSLSMAGGAVPNDGHVAGTADRTPYGTAGLPGTLEGYDVYFAVTTPGWAISDAHAWHVERFWTHSVAGHGATLQLFTEDLATLFDRAGSDAPDVSPSDSLHATDKLEMIQFAPDTGQMLDIHSATVSATPAPMVLRSREDISVGISWDCGACDLDLYLRPAPGAQVIFYGQAQTAEGRLFKDYLNSPNLTNGFETVAMAGPVDLEALRIAVNFYGGTAPHGTVSGEVRMAADDEVWSVPFAIQTSHGNGGQGAEAVMNQGTLPNAAWVLIDPLSVTKAE